MPKLRAPDEKSSSESMPPWSAETTCTTCGEYKPCRCSDEGNLCACLVTFSAWRKCCVCGSETLYVNSQARTDTDFECGICQRIREDLAKKLARPSLPMRAALHLRSLFSTANDNTVGQP